jgi:uncharacterized protein (DUF58 family)
MMIFPTRSMIVAVASTAIPTCTLAGLVPAAVVPCVLLLAMLFAIVAADAMRPARAIRGVMVTPDSPALKWFKGRRSVIRLRLGAIPPQISRIRLSLELPASICEVEPIAIDASPPAAIELACLPQERGRFQITTCHLAGSSPWRLWHVRSYQPVNIEISVFSDLRNENGAKVFFLRKPGGLRTQRWIGKGREFERLRDYVSGDSFEDVNWKATARRGRPIVKVFQVERTQDVYVIIDSSRLAAKRDRTDRFVNAALMVALAAEEQGDNFGLATFSDRVDHFVAAGRGKGHFSRCREAIYDLKARRVSPDFAELVAFLELRIRKRALLLFLTDLADPMLAEMFLLHSRLLARRHIVVVATLDEESLRPLFSGPLPESTEEIYSRLAGHLEWATFKNLEKKLNRLGIIVHTLRPQFAGVDLVAQYTQVKRSQLL